MAPHRSHLLRGPSKPSDNSFNQFEEVSTIRDPSDKEHTEKKSVLDRPPLQSRPSTTTKSRMYMAGLQQI